MRRTSFASESESSQHPASEGALERPFFVGFELTKVRGIRLREAGAGPLLLLLHGHPQTHAMWHAVAEQLSGEFTIVASDLPGYGGSAPTASGSKREVAAALPLRVRAALPCA